MNVPLRPSARHRSRLRSRLNILWGYCPEIVRGELRPYLVEMLWLVPGWCSSIYVQWMSEPGPDLEGAAMASGAQPEYRQGQIHVYPAWISHLPATRRFQLIHEILHLTTAPMVEEHSDVIGHLLGPESPKFDAYASEKWEKAFEGTIQDLATAIAMLPGPFPDVDFLEFEDADVSRSVPKPSAVRPERANPMDGIELFGNST